MLIYFYIIVYSFMYGIAKFDYLIFIFFFFLFLCRFWCDAELDLGRACFVNTGTEMLWLHTVEFNGE